MVILSPWGNIEGCIEQNLGSLVTSSKFLKNNLDKPILIDAVSEESLTAKQVINFASAVAYTLRVKYNINSNDVVALCTPNSIYLPPIHHGILYRGAAISPSNLAYNIEELSHQITTIDSKLFIISSEKLESLGGRTALKAHLKNTEILTLEQFIDTVKQIDSMEPQLAHSESPVTLLHGNSWKDVPAYYIFSSGTTGLPKAVITTHGNIVANCHQKWKAAGDMYSSKCIFGAVLPMSHIFGLSKFIYSTIYFAPTLIVFPTYDFELLLKSICKYRIDTLHAVPPILLSLAKNPIVSKYPISNSLHLVISGAAPLSESLIEELQVKLNLRVAQLYGLTETSPTTHFFTYNPKIYNPMSIGWLTPSCEARIVDINEKDVKQGERGELWIRGPNIMKGYYKNETATASAITKDGWFKTGDIAIVDKTGQFFIVDRVKELIKSKGHQVAPAELESILLSHEHVKDAAVIGVDNPQRATEDPRAYIVISKDCSSHPFDIIKWFNCRVSRHKRLTGGIVLMDAIPKTSSGKILRRQLRDRNEDIVWNENRPKI